MFCEFFSNQKSQDASQFSKIPENSYVARDLVLALATSFVIVDRMVIVVTLLRTFKTLP